jgi:hypothetical protein
MSEIVEIKATDGSIVKYVNKVIGQGGMKDVYFSPDKSYVVGFFRDKQDANSKDRLLNIVGVFRDRIFGQEAPLLFSVWVGEQRHAGHQGQ